MAENKAKFSCKYELTEELFNEYQSTVRPMKGFKFLYKSIFLVLIVLMLVLKMYMYAIAFAGAYFLTGLFTVFLMKMVYRLLKGSGDTVTLDYEFYENNILFSNLTTSGKKELLYTYIADIVETKNTILLNLKEQSSIILKKDTLQGGTRDELIKFLMKKAKDEDMVLVFTPYVEKKNPKLSKTLKHIVDIVVLALLVVSIALFALSIKNTELVTKEEMFERVKTTELEYFDNTNYNEGPIKLELSNQADDMRGCIYIYKNEREANSNFVDAMNSIQSIQKLSINMLNFENKDCIGFQTVLTDGDYKYYYQAKRDNMIIEIGTNKEENMSRAFLLIKNLIVK